MPNFLTTKKQQNKTKHKKQQPQQPHHTTSIQHHINTTPHQYNTTSNKNALTTAPTTRYKPSTQSQSARVVVPRCLGLFLSLAPRCRRWDVLLTPAGQSLRQTVRPFSPSTPQRSQPRPVRCRRIRRGSASAPLGRAPRLSGQRRDQRMRRLRQSGSCRCNPHPTHPINQSTASSPSPIQTKKQYSTHHSPPPHPKHPTQAPTTQSYPPPHPP